eukprot:scaffold53077_cov25-Attheya_sp.AAC.1
MDGWLCCINKPAGDVENSGDYFSGHYQRFGLNMRIPIEMAFSRLSTKWRIFRRNLDLSTELNSHIVEVAMKLHNFVIRSDGLNFVEVSDDKWESLEVESWDEGREGNKGYLEHVDSCSGDE